MIRFIVRFAWCCIVGHDVKDKGWGNIWCRRCGMQKQPWGWRRF